MDLHETGDRTSVRTAVPRYGVPRYACDRLSLYMIYPDTSTKFSRYGVAIRIQVDN
eukprot:SAG31_NODE_8524_length_1436_cov_1.335079_1_plen_56_part_00